MAIVIKVSTKDLYHKCTTIAETIKDIRQQIIDINSLEKELLSKYWAGEAADKNSKEFVALAEETGPVIVSLIEKPQQLLKMADIYDQVEQFNVNEEAGKLSSDFLL